MNAPPKLALGTLPVQRFVFLTLPNYSLIALSSAVDRCERNEERDWRAEGAHRHSRQGLSFERDWNGVLPDWRRSN